MGGRGKEIPVGDEHFGLKLGTVRAGKQLGQQDLQVSKAWAMWYPAA